MLEAVASARDEFTMMELGAGWGRWMAIAAAALRSRGATPYRFIGVEAEPTHFEWMHQHFRDNQVDLTRCDLIQAAIADRDGSVWFQMGRPSEWYGQSIVASPGWKEHLNDRLDRNASRNLEEQVRRVKAVSLNTLLGPLNKVDLVGLDVQGVELDVLRAAAGELTAKVKRVLVGTHSADIEAGLRAMFRGLGWENLYDYGCCGENQTPWGPITFVDGVQSWINPRL